MRIMSMLPLSCERCQIIFFYSSKIFSDMIEHFHDAANNIRCFNVYSNGTRVD